MSLHKSAMGKQVDMGTLVSKNELTRAVGNMGVNARGDRIDANGRVIQAVTEVVNTKYAQTVGNKSAQNRSGAGLVSPDSIRSSIDPAQLTAAERDLESSFEDDLVVEQIKAAEVAAKK